MKQSLQIIKIMKKIQFTLLFLVVTSFAFSQIPDGYYTGTEGFTGDVLRDKLKLIIKANHSSNSYGDLYGHYQTTDNYSNGKVWDMYSMHNDGTADYWFDHNNRGVTDENQDCIRCNEGGSYNREHSVPQSWFNSQYPMQADLFMVYPTDGCVNGMRGHHPYGETSNPNWTSTNGSKRGPCTYPPYISDTNMGNIDNEDDIIFEPADRFKGDFARTYFYAVTRYKDQISTWTDNVAPDVFEGDNLEAWQISLFLKWHRNDPVSQKEIDRNNAAYVIQHNRNPFIDHPEFAECIFADNCGFTFTSIPVTTAMATVEYTYNITYNTLEEGDIETLTATYPDWLTFTTNLAENSATLIGTPDVSHIGNHNVVLTLTEGSETANQNFTIEVTEFTIITNLLDEDFTNCLLNNWTSQSLSGDKDWACSSNSNEINAYGGNVACDDWFISPEINLNESDSEILTFKTWTQYTDDDITNPEVKLKYSTNYVDDPSTASWTEIPYNFANEDSQSWTESGEIDLSEIQGNSIRIAFHYTSSGTGGQSSTYWRLDDILLSADITNSISSLDSGIKIFPNPVGSILQISTKALGGMEIYNIHGQKVFQAKLKTRTDISALAPGIYVLHIETTDGESIVNKFVKK